MIAAEARDMRRRCAAAADERLQPPARRGCCGDQPASDQPQTVARAQNALCFEVGVAHPALMVDEHHRDAEPIHRCAQRPGDPGGAHGLVLALHGREDGVEEAMREHRLLHDRTAHVGVIVKHSTTVEGRPHRGVDHRGDRGITVTRPLFLGPLLQHAQVEVMSPTVSGAEADERLVTQIDDGIAGEPRDAAQDIGPMLRLQRRLVNPWDEILDAIRHRPFSLSVTATMAST